jgi:hypothetical protein
MRCTRLAGIVALAAILAAPAVSIADVKTQEKSHVKFEGMLGRMMGLFGGRAAKEGVVSTVAVKGDRRSSMSDSRGEIIDLAEEKIYEIDVRRKSYEVTTFAEMRKRLEEAEAKAREDARKAGEEPPPDPGGRELEVDFTARETGERKTINGFDTREVLVVVTVREKGKTLEEGGGLVMTTNSWLGPKIASMDAVADFDRRYAEKLGLGVGAGDAAQMAAALAMYPGLKQAFSKFDAENVKMDGTAVLTTTTIETVRSEAQMAEQQQEPEGRPASVGGMLGGLGKRVIKKEPPKQRSTLMTGTHELMSVTTGVTPEDVAVPAGYKQRK